MPKRTTNGTSVYVRLFFWYVLNFFSLFSWNANHWDRHLMYEPGISFVLFLLAIEREKGTVCHLRQRKSSCTLGVWFLVCFKLKINLIGDFYVIFGWFLGDFMPTRDRSKQNDSDFSLLTKFSIIRNKSNQIKTIFSANFVSLHSALLLLLLLPLFLFSSHSYLLTFYFSVVFFFILSPKQFLFFVIVLSHWNRS